MGELQATLEVQVELGKFYNIDLFQRGYYQIRTTLKTNPKLAIKTELSLPHNSECDLIFPASIMNGVAVSKTFQILYRNEDVTVNDIILYKIHMLIDSKKMEESIAAADLQVVLELWFSDDEFGPDQQEKQRCISQRMLKLNMQASKGIHHHVPILFDYFHLCAVTLTVHASLLSISQPYLNLKQNVASGGAPPPPKQAWNATKDSPTLETILFGSTVSSNSAQTHPYSLNPRIEHATKIYKSIAHLLLSAYESLQDSCKNLINKLPKHLQVEIDHVDCHHKLEKMSTILKSLADEETFLEIATSDITHLCAENVILWTQYLELVNCNDIINYALAKEHHNQRVKRFSEAFFTYQFPKQQLLSCYDPSIHGHTDLYSIVKNSEYFQQMPPLPVECVEMDGDHTMLPIIFENVFCEESVAKHLHFTEEVESSEKQVVEDVAFARKGSRLSDAGSQHSSESSPKMRKNKLKFIKNIKPETFKRPSSFIMTDGTVSTNAGGSVAIDPLDCSLVGYRKIDNSIAVSQVELGTLSPGGKHSVLEQDSATKALYNAVSMPTLLAKGDLSLNTSGSMPDLSAPTELPHSKSSDDLTTSQPSGSQEVGDIAIESQEGSNTTVGTKCDQGTDSVGKGKELSEKDSDDTSQSDSGSNTQDIQNGYFSESDRYSPQQDAESEAVNRSATNGACAESSQTSGPSNKIEVAITDPCISKVTDTQSNKDDVGSGQTTQAKIQDNSSSNENDNSANNEAAVKISSDDAKAPEDDDEDDGMSKKCTLMELLKEEYERTEKAKETKNVKDLSSYRVPGSRASLSSVKFAEVGRIKSGAGQTHAARIKSMMVSSSAPDLSQYRKEQRLVSPVEDTTINFITAKENLRRQLKYNGHIYSDFPSQISTQPYFWTPEIMRGDDEGLHLIVCVHGLDGNSADLRLIRTYLEMCLPNSRLDFLMSERNQPDTFADFEVMTDRLVDEILYHIELYGISPAKISFVGHSLGNLIIRSVISRPKMAPLLPKLHTFLSLSGPHLGTLYNTSGLVNMGMWFMQKWKKSGSLLQLSLKDHPDLRQTFIYQLSTRPGLEFFKNILLVGSTQDRYVPFHSSRIELCKSASKDNSTSGAVYCEMVNNILQPIVFNSSINLIRYDVFYALPSTANSMIGRAAHIAVLDSEIFIEKMISVCALKYFK